jgi:hypothetical protein
MPKKTEIRDSIPADLRMKVAESIIEEWRGRKRRRKDLEKHWKEIDRQLRMEPELSHKTTASGTVVPGLEWLPETEMPLQAQTLEMLMADSRRLKFPKNRDWFSTRAALTGDYLERYKAAGSPVPGDKSGQPTELVQDEADRIAASVLAHWHSQYDFRGAVDLIDASAFAYSFGVGRVRKVRRKVMGHSARVGPREEVIPVLVPRDAKKVYLDDSLHAIMHEGEILGPNIIQHKTVKIDDLRAIADSDSTYLKDEVSRLAPDKKGNVDLVELEGDLVVDAGMVATIVRNVVVTAAVGSSEGKDTYGLVRIEEGEGESTYLISHYQLERTADVYGSSPLLKGMPIARIIAQIMNRLLESGQLKNAPPIGYNRDDPSFATRGGPKIAPYALFETTDPLQVYDQVGGDPGALFNIFSGLVQMYSDVTGVTPARLGAMTKSHTTAFAKDVEQNRGESRTVDYVNGCLEGWMPRLLELEYRMGLKGFKQTVVYIDAWKEFAEFKRGHLPDTVKFIAEGAGSPAEDEARQQRRFNAAQAALQIDALAVQSGKAPTIDPAALIETILKEGGWADPSEITIQSAPGDQGPAQQGGQLPGVASAPPESLLP